MGIMTNNQTKLFNFSVQIEQGNDTPELYAEIKGSYDDEHYAITIMDALMRRYPEDVEKFSYAFTECGCDGLMSADDAITLLNYCAEAQTITREEREKRIEMFVNILDVADRIDSDNFTMGRYAMVASPLLNNLLIRDNIELANRVNAYLYDKDTTNSNLPTYILTTIGRL